jgi:hypothetical protein
LLSLLLLVFPTSALLVPQTLSFAIAGVLLSALGIYGVIAFSVALREQEMAVRMALGGQRSGVILLILSSGAKLAALGCGLGLLGAVAASRLLRSFLFEVSPFDPGVLALSAIAMLLLAQLLHYRPGAHRVRIPCWLCEANRKMPTIFGKPHVYAISTLEMRWQHFQERGHSCKDQTDDPSNGPWRILGFPQEARDPKSSLSKFTGF